MARGPKAPYQGNRSEARKIGQVALQTFYIAIYFNKTYRLVVRNLAICPNCKQSVGAENIVREQIDDGQKAKVANLVSMKVRTTMFSCSNCHVTLGVAQYTSY